jgi:hypothetical protein
MCDDGHSFGEFYVLGLWVSFEREEGDPSVLEIRIWLDKRMNFDENKVVK